MWGLVDIEYWDLECNPLSDQGLLQSSLSQDCGLAVEVREDGEHSISARTQTLGEKRKSVSFAECELPAKKEKEDLHKTSLERE